MRLKSRSSLKNSKGQIVVEYVLLLVIAVSIAALLVNQLASRGDEPGVIVAKWYSILKTVGDDNPDAHK
ncbi:hypothetical protein D3C87_143730 [compost metagenome]